jgi:hypothetical protein
VSSIEDKRKARAAFMNHLYDAGDGSERYYESYVVIGSAVGLEAREASEVADYLVGEGLAEWFTTDGGVSITHPGVVEVERSRTAPDQPTEHFAAYNNVIFGTFYNSPIQQGTTASFQLNQPMEELNPLVDQFIYVYRERIDELSLAEEQRAEAEAELATLQAQISSPNPKRPVIAASLQVLRDFALSAGGSAAAQAILSHWGLFGVR